MSTNVISFAEYSTNLHKTILHDYSKFNFILKQARAETDPWKCTDRIHQLKQLESNILQNLQGPIRLWTRITCREEISKELTEKIQSISEYNDARLFPDTQVDPRQESSEPSSSTEYSAKLHQTILHDYSYFNLILKKAYAETNPWKCCGRLNELLRLQHSILQNLQEGPIQLWTRTTSREEISKELSEKTQSVEAYNAHLFSLSDKLNFKYRPGCHTIKSPVVGTRAEELIAVKHAIESNSVLAQLEKSIYNPELIHIIPTTKKDEADEISQSLFRDYISKYTIHGCNEQNIITWNDCGMTGLYFNKTRIYDKENVWNTWFVQAIVEKRHDTVNEMFDRYLPPHIVAYHELMHVEETPVRAKRSHDNENGNELLTTIKTVILLDVVYKKIHGLDKDAEVNYNKLIEINSKKIKLGEFVNFYRMLENKHGKLSDALISKESLDFLS